MKPIAPHAANIPHDKTNACINDANIKSGGTFDLMIKASNATNAPIPYPVLGMKDFHCHFQ